MKFKFFPKIDEIFALRLVGNQTCPFDGQYNHKAIPQVDLN